MKTLTEPQITSIEEFFIKVSLRTLWYLLAGVVVSTIFIYSCYVDLKQMNEQILVRLDRLEQATAYKIETNEKDIARLELRLSKLEAVK